MVELDEKKRKIQQEYREKMKQRKVGKKHTLEAVIVIFSLLLLIGLFTFINGDDYENFSTESEWRRVISTIDNELNNNAYYTSIAYDYNPKPIKIIVKTSISETNLDKEIIEDDLLITVNNIIVEGKLPDLLKENETYEIIIEGKNYKELKHAAFP